MKNLAKLEPIRLYVYGLLGPVVAVIIGYGLYDRERTLLIAGIVAAVLTIPAAEKARSMVTPVEKTVFTGNIAQDVQSTLNQGLSMFQQAAVNALPGILGPVVQRTVNQALDSSQMPTQSVPSGKVDSALVAPATSENPYA